MDQVEPQPCRMSWDNILCESCRNQVDTELPLRSPLRSHFDWHTAGSLEECAIRSCSLCALVLDAFQFDAKSRQVSVPANMGITNVPIRARPQRHREDGYEVLLEYRASDVYLSAVLFFRFQRKHDPTPRSNWAASTSSSQTMRKIDMWLSQCQTHEPCNRWPTLTGILPEMRTRLLQLDTGADSEAPDLRLIMTDTMTPTQYATLSHRWGNHSSLKLVQQELKQFAHRIEWYRLPQTFQDAVTVCLALKISYLWIDSLCIIQDSPEDWARESGRMAQVYGNSHLNISAMDSRDGSGGLFRSRDPASSSTATFPAERVKGQSDSYILAYSDTWYTCVEQTPLNERAWVLQERFLSPRVVHFCSDQVHWECADLITSENLPCTLDRDLFVLPTPNKTAIRHLKPIDVSTATTVTRNMWVRLVAFYSRAKLSVKSDRPVAVAGLARAFCHLQNLDARDYLAGHWRPYFISGLMWASFEPRLPDSLNIPSWSWLSVDGQVYLDDPLHINGVWSEDELWYNVAQIVEARTSPTTEDALGPVSNGYVKFRAPLCRLSVNIKENGILPPTTIILGEARFDSRDSCFVLTFDGPDVKSTFTETPVHVYILLCMASRGLLPSTSNPPESVAPNLSKTEIPVSYRLLTSRTSRVHRMFHGFRYGCLVLLPTALPGHFRRIGVFYANPGSDEASKTLATALDSQFWKSDVPLDLYEAVDEEFFYTITLV